MVDPSYHEQHAMGQADAKVAYVCAGCGGPVTLHRTSEKPIASLGTWFCMKEQRKVKVRKCTSG